MNQGMLWSLSFVLAAAVGWIVRRTIQSRADSQRTGGPVLYPVVGNVFDFLRNSHRFLEWSTEYVINSPSNTFTTGRFGSTFKITGNPATVEHILKTNFENYPKGEHLRQSLTDLLGDGIFNVDGELWKIQRRLASFEFTTRSLREFLMDSLADEVHSRLLPTLASVSRDGKEIDLQDLFMRFNFDNICKLSFGVDPACLDPSFPEVKFAQAFDKATTLSTLRFQKIHPLVWKLMRALNVGPERELKEVLDVVNEFAVSVVQKRREEKGRVNQDLLSRFIGLDSTSFSDEFLRDIIISFVLAGKDTTAVSLSWFFWLLSNHPGVQQEIIREVGSIVAKGSDRPFTYEELRDMVYLQAALCESMRLYPPVPIDTKVVKNSDVLPDGNSVEKGMKVSYHVYAMGRMESLWGKDCLEFKPERWIQDGQFVAVSPFKFPVFQAGPRVCLGKEMAMLQMKYVVAALVPKFELVVGKEEPCYGINMTLIMKDGLPVVPKLR
ncbi:cytochrome P450 94A2 [Selaginella moellendorffii]|nr:cytochrome P450 94A2 [Selaginella moellendorffii]XP_024525509.1 cytochrome P450 94A2 [Selaginella moellendorffii]XP_024525511.1 cytochrome P450 94A2 [Selaginella moellendorffii]|eukprot:XP_002964775.2 cytochrome P450 94A2 [Selaginella moellendorffii]